MSWRKPFVTDASDVPFAEFDTLPELRSHMIRLRDSASCDSRESDPARNPKILRRNNGGQYPHAPHVTIPRANLQNSAACRYGLGVAFPSALSPRLIQIAPPNRPRPPKRQNLNLITAIW